MKAIIKKHAEEGLWMEEVPRPEPKEHEVLIKTLTSSICGTDLHIYKWDRWAQKNVPLSTIVGHEFMGEIAEVGHFVEGFSLGDRVSGEGHITCGSCRNCRMGQKHHCPKTSGLGYHVNGCFAEYFTLPASNVFLLPEAIDNEIASLCDPLGNAVHTALSCDLVGEDVLITGAGPIGIMAAAVAKHAGARHVVITDLNDYRLKLALDLGATRAVNVSKESLKEATQALGIDEGYRVGLEMSGSEKALRQLLESMQPGGEVALLGIFPEEASINWDLVIFKMLTLKGIWGREIFSTWYKMLHMLESGLSVERVITHRFDADNFMEGIRTMESGECGKVLLNWTP